MHPIDSQLSNESVAVFSSQLYMYSSCPVFLKASTPWDQGQPRTSSPAHLNLTGIIHEPHCSCCIICNNWPANCCIICNDSVWAKNARTEESNQPVGFSDRLIKAALWRSAIWHVFVRLFGKNMRRNAESWIVTSRKAPEGARGL